MYLHQREILFAAFLVLVVEPGSCEAAENADDERSDNVFDQNTPSLPGQD